MSRRAVGGGIHWIQECGPNREQFIESRNTWPEDWYAPGHEVHIPQNAYLLDGEETLLLDTLSPAAADTVVAEVEALLSGRPLDYLVLSHPDVPHAGNTARLMEAHPELELVAPAACDTHELYHLDEARKVGPGDGIDLGGLEVRFHEATFMDAPLHLWMTEETTGTFFPVDWLGFPHLSGECLRFEDEIDAEVGLSRLVEFHGRVMFWHQYAQAEKVAREIDRLARKFDPRAVAPAHGLVVRREPVRLMELMKQAAAHIAETGRVGVLG